MKITIDYEDGRNTTVIEDVMDYAVFNKDDLIHDFNEIMDGKITWDELPVKKQGKIFYVVKNNIGCFDSFCSSEEFYCEVRAAITEVGI